MAGRHRDPDPGRRRFIGRVGLIALGGLAARPAAASVRSRAPGERMLAFYNTHTGESLKTVYWARGDYSPEALTDIDYILRDFRSGDVKPIAPQLLDVAHELQRMLDSTAPIHVISGYRSPATNAALAARSGGVARHSLHLEGEALDLRLPGRELKDVQRAALALRRGGVGYYPRSNFVHIDIGRVRTW